MQLWCVEEEQKGKVSPTPFFFSAPHTRIKWFKEDIKREVEMGSKYISSHKAHRRYHTILTYAKVLLRASRFCPLATRDGTSTSRAVCKLWGRHNNEVCWLH